MISVQDLSRVENRQYDSFEIAFLPSIAVVSLIQDGYTEISPIVAKNDLVKEGEIIATNKNKLDACIHSPVPGKVLDIYHVTMPNGKKAPAILIKLEGSFSFSGKKINDLNWLYSSALTRNNIFKNMGIVNTFEKPISLSQQVEEAKNSARRPLVVRLFDNYPNICVDDFITKQYAKEVLEGTAILADTIDASHVVFVAKKDTWTLPDEIEIKKLFKAISVNVIYTDDKIYPNGNYKIIKQQSLDFINTQYAKKMNDILAVDSSTCLDIYNSITHEYPVIEKFIDIEGDAIAKNGIYRIRIGSTLRNIFEECGGFIENPAKIIINGLINGVAVSDLDTPITKYVKSIHVLSSRGYPDQRQTSCIRCGRCHQICPEFIHPEKIFSHYYSDTPINDSIINTIDLCTNCGLCNVICPSRIPLSQTIQLIRDNQNEKNI